MDTESRSPSKSVEGAGEASGALSPDPDLFEHGVYRRLLDEGHRFQFSQAVRLLELLFPDAPAPGDATSVTASPIHVRPSVDLSFPPTDVKRVEWADGDPRGVHVVATFLGLYGIDAPLPYHFHNHLAKDPEETAPHRDFLDIFNHRLYAFFYRAWKKYRPHLHYRPGERDRHSSRFISLAGVGTPNALSEVSLSPMRLAAQAGVLAPQTRNAAGLEALVAAFFDGIEVQVCENVPRWVSIPSRSRLGNGSLRLGESATIGEKVYDRSGKFRLQLGPMSVEQYLALLPRGEDVPKLRDLVRLYAPDHLAYDVELRIRSEDLPTSRLGESGNQLGFTTSVGAPGEPIISRVVDYEADSGAHATVRS
ncbi:type VI secretion system baseplate subunit TssG [Salinibacter ruber]|jgi:type VI secretion system protein ImpH|uniref:type VI secretion system baseplate subunit TssG n=1 Tax=Salinibacter ruber TaxID=146919 RepID=UPI000E6CC24D|nr:type VI secretion system baseplate subunit TssG [Salinibacter ruber]MBB4070224.1 type VI secretion system protein ImpH [Salinibacter ruber]